MKKLLVIGLLAAMSSVAMADPADQPHMDKALTALREAREQLQKATHDKGGHRVKAIQAINAAIDEVQQGIEFDRTHSGNQEQGRQAPGKPGGKPSKP